jgi:Bacterial Ig-like domain
MLRSSPISVLATLCALALTPVPAALADPPPDPPTLQAPDITKVLSTAEPQFVFATQPFYDVDVVIDGTDVGISHADGAGRATTDLTAPLTDGEHTIAAAATDLGHHTGPFSADQPFIIDTTGPDSPTMLSPVEDLVTANPVVQLTFLTETGATVALSIDGGPATSQVSGLDGHVVFDVGPLADGRHEASVVATDPYGNPDAATVHHFTTDTTAPAAPVIVTPAAGSRTLDPRPAIAFATAEADEVVHISIDGVDEGAAQSDDAGAGTFALDADSALADGAHAITADARDEVGNVSARSAPVLFAVGPAPPDPPVIADQTPATPDVPIVVDPPTLTPFTLTHVLLHGSTLSLCAPHARRCTARTAQLRYSVSRAAVLHLTLERKRHGRWSAAAKVTVRASHAGAGSYVLRRRIGGHTLPPGTYRVVVEATSTVNELRSRRYTIAVSVR